MISRFKSMRHSRSLLVLGTMFCLLSLGACAPQTSEKLPDDPGHEVVSAPGAGAPSDGGSAAPAPPAFQTPAPPAFQTPDSTTKYSYLDPSHLIPSNLLKAATQYYDANLSQIKNTSVITIVDFSMPSNKARMYIVDMKSGAVWALHVAHGKGSDTNGDGYAETFSNIEGSNASSLGFFLTAETYSGAHGLSLRLDGLSTTNSNVRSRAIVVHGATYVEDRDVIQGRSWGCFAVPMNDRDKVISLLKEGSLMYAGLSAKK